MPNGYWKKVLRVDLNNRSISVDEPDDVFYRRYFGGAGFIAYHLLKELKPGIDPLGPDNKLVVMPGPATGQAIPGAGRDCIGAKSPMTDAFGRSEGGGFFGAELKRAGFDGIIVEGQSETPVYLWIRDGEVEIRDAAHLWGKPTKESQEAIRQELGDPLIRAAQIGPGGENMVRFACVLNDLKSAHGRAGMGAVMGSKKLKAIAVRGHKAPDVADPEAIRKLAKWVTANVNTLARGFHEFGTGAAMKAYAASGNLPIRNFQGGDFPEVDSISAVAVRDTIRVGMEGCYSCPVRCKKVVKVEGRFEADPAYGGPEYETLASCGSNCGVGDLKAIAHAHHLAHQYSLDTISLGSTVAFAMECFERGILTTKDTDGLDLRFGNGDAMCKLIEKIGKREGIGDLLAEGTRKAAQKIGKGAIDLAVQVKGVEFGMHDARLKHGLGLGYSVCAYGGDHGTGLHDTEYEKDGPNLQKAKQLGILDPLPATDLSARKVALFAALHKGRALFDSSVICYFLPYDHQQVADILKAVTGWNTSLYECMKVGERVLTLSRAFNVREGLTPEDDTMPKRMFTPFEQGPLKGRAVPMEQMEHAKSDFYAMMGWDSKTGVPRAQKLDELGIGWVKEELARWGKGPA